MSFALLIAAFSGGFTALVYPYMARRRGWRVERSFHASGGYVMTIAFASVMAAILLTLTQETWWHTVVLILTGSVISVVVINVLKSTVQPLTLGVMAMSWVWYFLVAGL